MNHSSVSVGCYEIDLLVAGSLSTVLVWKDGLLVLTRVNVSFKAVVKLCSLGVL